jgi:hypothetical protein
MASPNLFVVQHVYVYYSCHLPCVSDLWRNTALSLSAPTTSYAKSIRVTEHHEKSHLSGIWKAKLLVCLIGIFAYVLDIYVRHSEACYAKDV